MEPQRLDDEWRAGRRSNPIDTVMRFDRAGLVLGLGTVLAKAGATDRDIAIDVAEPRFLTLLTAAHLRPATPLGLAHLRKAAERWRDGRDALAAMHLALSGLDRLKHPVSDARRLFFTDRLLDADLAAGSGISALTLTSPTDDVSKYSPDQPRVPAGSGRPSGQWTSGEGPASEGSAPSPTPDHPARASPSNERDANASSSGAGQAGRSEDQREFSIELPSTIACAAPPRPVTPFNQAVKAVADSIEVADSVSKWRELGPKGEALIREAVQARGWTVLGIQVPVRTRLGLRVEDVMVRVPAGATGNATAYNGFIEVKVNGGRYSQLQQDKDALIGAEGGILLRPVWRYRAGRRVKLETGLANMTIRYEPD